MRAAQKAFLLRVAVDPSNWPLAGRLWCNAMSLLMLKQMVSKRGVINFERTNETWKKKMFTFFYVFIFSKSWCLIHRFRHLPAKAIRQVGDHGFCFVICFTWCRINWWELKVEISHQIWIQVSVLGYHQTISAIFVVQSREAVGVVLIKEWKFFTEWT